MDTRIARPMDSHRAGSAPRVYTCTHIATARPQTAEKAIRGNSSLGRPHPMAATIVTGPTETINRNAVATPKSSRLPTSTATICSRPGATPQPGETASRAAAPSARNFSRVQPRAATRAARPNMRGKAGREVGFENWAFRHESISALPRPARGREYAAAGIVRSYKGRVPSVIHEDDEAEQLSALPSTPSTPAASEKLTGTVRWQGDRARRLPVHVQAAPIRSQAASLAAATATAESVRSTGAVRPLMRPGRSPLPSSPLRRAPLTAAGVPRTYIEMQDSMQLSPTRLAPRTDAPADWGENYSPYSAGTTTRMIDRRAKLARKFPLSANAAVDVPRERVFRAPFVDAPSVVGGRVVVKAPVVAAVLEAPSVVAVAAPEVGAQPAEKKKGKWRRFSGYLSRKLKRKGKGASSSSSLPASSPSASSPQTPASRLSLVYGPSISEPPSPVTPARAEAESFVVVATTPPQQAIHVTACREDVRSISPLSPAEKALSVNSEPVSPLGTSNERDNIDLAQAAATLAMLREYDELMGPPSASPSEEDEHSPLEDADADLFPLLADNSKRWARAESTDETLHEGLAEMMAEEHAAADWSGSQEMIAQAQQVECPGKGKARVVDMPPMRSRYRARRGASQDPQSGASEADVAQERRDTVGPEDGKVRRESREEKSDSEPWRSVDARGPIVAISGLRS